MFAYDAVAVAVLTHDAGYTDSGEASELMADGTGYLTTHVLDTAKGCPAAGLQIELYRLDGSSRERIGAFVTNDDGRTESPVLPSELFETGVYELVFHAGDYLDRTVEPANGARFLDVIPIRFTVADAASHYHVPLLLSPFGYATYRGS